jgi:hypothetical protein
MPKLLYCWRCRMELPMLDEHEWEQMQPHLHGRSAHIMQYRRTYGVPLDEAVRHGYDGALELYSAITGFRETNPNALWHHRASQFGPPCRVCGKPLRTPRAKLCAACGAPRDARASQ